jgi:hypothetical protein
VVEAYGKIEAVEEVAVKITDVLGEEYFETFEIKAA